jgi:hypothetical protein
MAILNKTGITNGGTIQAEHVTRTIDALTGGSTDTIVATGSFSGSFTGTVTGTLTGTASFATSASYVLNATSASYAISASNATTASFVLTAQTASLIKVTNDTTSETPLYLTAINSNNGALEPEQLLNIGVTYTPDTNLFDIGGGTVSAAGYNTTITSSIAFQGTASYAMTSSRAISSSFATTASYVAYASSFPYTGSAIISGSLTTTGSLNISGSINSTSTITTANNFVSTKIGGSLYLRSPNGDSWQISITNAGVLSASMAS